MGSIIADYEQFDNVLSILAQCTDDYLFIYDLKEDHYKITERAVDTFKLDEADFYDALNVLTECIYPEDRLTLKTSIERLKAGELDKHDLEYRWLDKGDNPIWISCRGKVTYDSDGNVHYLVGRIAELGRKNKIDNITGLYREIVLRNDISNMRHDMVYSGFLLLVGIDNFKDINEHYGREMGNKILHSLAGCIRKSAKSTARIYRMSGDEIMIFYDDINTKFNEPAKELYKNIRSAVDNMIRESGYELFYTISAGAAYFTESDAGNLNLLEQAEFALRLAKVRGKNTYVKYKQKDYTDYLIKLDMQEHLRKSVENSFEGFELYYQPIVNIEEKSILGAEALLRWHSSEAGGLVSPGDFIPLLEESGLIIPVGKWVIETAMEQCIKWQKVCPDFRVSINISFVQIKKSNVLHDIDSCIEKLGFQSRNVLFEITESGELEVGFMTKNVLEAFQRRRLNLAIDDFGTGYSNLRYIKDMMFNLVKIDQAFIRGIRNSKYDYMVVKQFTELAHSLNLKVCYEGVETEEDFNCARELKPDYIQGFYFAKPVSSTEFEEKYLGKTDLFI